MNKLVNLDHFWDKVLKEWIHCTFADQESELTCACSLK